MNVTKNQIDKQMKLTEIKQSALIKKPIYLHAVN